MNIYKNYTRSVSSRSVSSGSVSSGSVSSGSVSSGSVSSRSLSSGSVSSRSGSFGSGSSGNGTNEDDDITKEHKKSEKECKFKYTCIKNLKESLVDSTKENTALYTLLSGVTASVGLATNSPATIIGSMLLSPIGDIIVRLSIIGNFDSLLKNGLTPYNFSRQAFQERYLDRLGIKTKKLIIDNDKKDDSLIIRLKKISDKNIEEITKFENNIYYKINEKLYNINGKNIENIEFTNEKYTITTKQIQENIKKYEKEKIKLFKIKPYKHNWWNILGWGIIICLIAIFSGFICGLFFILAQNEQENPNFVIPTKEMEDRGKIENAIGMIFIAIIAGFILPESIRYKNTIRLVGINIATALLPPLVNVGLYLAILCLKGTDTKGVMNKVTSSDISSSIITSLIIFLINFVLLYSIARYRLSTMCKGKPGIFKDFDLC